MRTFKRLPIVLLAASTCLFAADPIFLRRQVPDVRPQPDELAPDGGQASYKPLFGIGDKDDGQLQGVARYGEITVAPGGTSAIVSYPAEEQMYFIEDGRGTLLYGDEKVSIKKNDFLYLPVGVRHGVANSSDAPVKVIVMGYKLPAGTKVEPTPKLMLASADDVPLQVLGSHGPTTQFKLLMGLTSSTRDKLSSAYVMDSLFIMDFAPGGQTFPIITGRRKKSTSCCAAAGTWLRAWMRTARKCGTPSRREQPFSSSRARKSVTTATPERDRSMTSSWRCARSCRAPAELSRM